MSRTSEKKLQLQKSTKAIAKSKTSPRTTKRSASTLKKTTTRKSLKATKPTTRLGSIIQKIKTLLS